VALRRGWQISAAMLANFRFLLHQFGTEGTLPALPRCLAVRAERDSKPANGAKDESKNSTFSSTAFSLANKRTHEVADDGPEKDYLHRCDSVAGSDSKEKVK
jgi:hypothetical protein